MPRPTIVTAYRRRRETFAPFLRSILIIPCLKLGSTCRDRVWEDDVVRCILVCLDFLGRVFTQCMG
jgi:hypothetical protein